VLLSTVICDLHFFPKPVLTGVGGPSDPYFCSIFVFLDDSVRCKITFVQFVILSKLESYSFHERISPADERVRTSVNQLVSDGLAIVRQTPFKGEWNISSRYDPSGKLPPPSSRLGLDSEE